MYQDEYKLFLGYNEPLQNPGTTAKHYDMTL